MRGARAYGSRQAARAGGAVSQLVGGAAGDPGAAGGGGRGGRVEGAVSRVGRHGTEGGAVYGNPVPAVGRLEGVAATEDRAGEYFGGGEWAVWECGRGGGSGGDDAVGRAEDADDVGAGEGGGRGDGGEDVEGWGGGGVFQRDGAEGGVDLDWGCGVFGELSVGI